MVERLIAVARALTTFELVVGLFLVALPGVVGSALIANALGADGAPATVAWLSLSAVLVLTAVAIRLARRRAARRSTARAADEWVSPATVALEPVSLRSAFATLPARDVAAYGSSSRARWPRDVLAWQASTGRLDCARLGELLSREAEGDSAATLLLGDLVSPALLALGRLMAMHPLADDDARIGMIALRRVARSSAGISEDDAALLVERLLIGGHLAEARRVGAMLTSSSVAHTMLVADLVHPEGIGSGDGVSPAEKRWLAAFNGIFRPFGLETVRLRETGTTPWERLDSAPSQSVADGPLVSVVMTCFRPGERTRSAVRSLINQTWQNWELLLMDDASPEEFAPFLRELAASDPRIRLIQATRNAGTYVRRNEAVRASAGEFVTIQDSDDWSHPRRLELQARHLVANPDVIANTANAVRVTDDLRFAQPRGVWMRFTEASIFFRKEETLSRVGLFDAVRKAADTEFRMRLEHVTGHPVPTVDTLGPMMLMNYTPDSLSASDLGGGWVDPARVAYRSAHAAWRETTRESGELVLPLPRNRRPFPAPDSIRGVAARRSSLDVVVAFDGRRHGLPAAVLSAWAAELRELSATLSVGFVQFDSPLLSPPVSAFSPTVLEVQQLINEGVVTRVLPSDRAAVRHLVVRHASALQSVDARSVAIVSDSVIVVEDEAAGIDRRGVTFAEPDVRRNAADLRHGGEIRWVHIAPSSGSGDLLSLLSLPVDSEAPTPGR